MRQPVLILSDLHLGHKGSLVDDVSALRPLIEGSGTLLLNGDTWQELAREFRADGERLWTELQQMCAQMGIDVMALPGNHDPGNGDCGYVELASGKIVITHGDCVFAEGAPWSRMAIAKHKEWMALWTQRPTETIDQRLALGRELARMLVAPSHGRSQNLFLRAWDALMPPGRALRMVLSWATMVSETRKFFHRYFPAAEVMICGHFHRAGIWDEKEGLVINTGSFMPPGAAYWCEWTAGNLRVGKIERQKNEWQRGEVMGIWSL